MTQLSGLCRAMFVALGLLSISASSHAENAKWVRAESPHFILYSNNGPKVTQTYLTRLEQYRYLLTRFHGQTAADDAETPKLNIYFLDNRSDLAQTWPKVKENVQGYFKNCAEGQAAFAIYQDDVDTSKVRKVQDQAENTSQVVLFHEYTHNFMFQTSSDKYPKWFVEGFAEYYSTVKFQDDQAVVGMESRMRAYTLNGRDILSYEQILRDDKSVRANDNATAAFYAQSWLLTHYVMSTPERKNAMGLYLEAYGKGEDPVIAFEHTFGIKVKDLSRLLYTYQNKLMATLYRLKDIPTADITLTTMPVSSNKLLLWDAADRVCPPKDYAPILLANITKEAAKFPDDDYARMTQARADIHIGDESKALDYLLAYTAAHPEDAESRFMLGQTWFLMTVHNQIKDGETRETQIAKAKSALGKAYQLDPLNAANLFYYSMALDTHAEIPSENTINAAIAAHDLAPSVDSYAIRAATLLIRKDRSEEAATMLYPLANNPHNDREAQWASTIIRAIENKATREDLLKLLKTPQSLSSTDEQKPEKPN